MADHLRSDMPTPHGGAYSEIFFFDENGNAVDQSEAVRCVIRECSEKGDLLFETWGVINKS